MSRDKDAKIIPFPIERRNVECVICVGAGRIWSGRREVTCPACGGTGRG